MDICVIHTCVFLLYMYIIFVCECIHGSYSLCVRFVCVRVVLPYVCPPMYTCYLFLYADVGLFSHVYVVFPYVYIVSNAHGSSFRMHVYLCFRMQVIFLMLFSFVCMLVYFHMQVFILLFT